MELAAAQGQGRHVQLAAAEFPWWGSACMHTGFQSMAESHVPGQEGRPERRWVLQVTEQLMRMVDRTMVVAEGLEQGCEL